MGSTVTCGKLAAAFKDQKGRVLYALFEKSYSKNVHPHTPRWSCVAFGTYEDVMNLCIAYSSDCEGGMLQGTSGWIKPENYIVAWQRALAKPLALPDMQIQLELSTNSYATMCTEKSELACAALAAIGRQDIWDAVVAGQKVSINLYKDADIIMALYGGTSCVYQPWRILCHSSYFQEPQEDLSPQRANGDFQPPEVELYRLDAANGVKLMVGRIGDKPLRILDSDYSVVASYIINVVRPLEIKHTGCAKHLINEFRERCNNAPVLPAETVFKVCCNADGLSQYQRGKARELAVHLGIFADGSNAELRDFSFTAGQLMGNQHLVWLLGWLSKEHVAVELPSAALFQKTSERNAQPERPVAQPA